MLNTLLPPVHEHTKLPSKILTLQRLKDERQTFIDLIKNVQKSGPCVLRPLLNENRGPNDPSGWTSVQKALVKYLRVSMNMIQDCTTTVGPESFGRYTDTFGKESKHDSGVSFGSDRRPSVGASLQESKAPEPVQNFAPAPKSLSTIERITREFKRMRVKPRPEIEEITQMNHRTAAETVAAPNENTSVGKKSLKKARSLASLRFGNGSAVSLASRKGSDAVPFDADQMKKHRLMYEASAKTSNGRV